MKFTLDNEMKKELTDVISAAVTSAAMEYFVWSKGTILYEAGAEPLITSSIARKLNEKFGADDSFEIHLEYKTSLLAHKLDLLQIQDFRWGRLDLFGKSKYFLLFVEAKRWSAPVSTLKDILRLCSLVSAAKRMNISALGVVAATEFYYDNDKFDHSVEYPIRLANYYKSQHDVIVKPVVGKPQYLDQRYKNLSGRDRVLSVLTTIEQVH